jgi:hypothetical protein
LILNTLRRTQRHQNIQAARTLQNTFRGSKLHSNLCVVIYYLIKALDEWVIDGASSDDIPLHSSRSKLDTQNISYNNPPHSSSWRQSLEIGTQSQGSTAARVSSASSSCAQQTHTLTNNLSLSLALALLLLKLCPVLKLAYHLTLTTWGKIYCSCSIRNTVIYCCSGTVI